MSRGSFRETAFIVEELGMIEIGTLDVSGSAPGDGPDVGGENFGIALLEAFIAFPQRFRDRAGHRFAGGLGDSLGKTVGFRVFDIEAHGISIFLYQMSTFLYRNVFPDSRKGISARWSPHTTCAAWRISLKRSQGRSGKSTIAWTKNRGRAPRTAPEVKTRDKPLPNG